MTDVVSIIGGAIAILAVVGPIIVAKYKEATYAISVVQSFLNLLGKYGQAIADGTVTDEEYIAIGKEFCTLGIVTHLDTTIKAEIPIPQNAVDGTVKIVETLAPLVNR